MPAPEIQIHGYAIVSADDRIAIAGQDAPGLHNEADWAYFQRELDRADLVALGRLGHEANPNIKPAGGWFSPLAPADWNNAATRGGGARPRSHGAR